MSLTFEQAQDEMLTLLKAAWDPTGHKMFYEGIRDQRETDTSSWAQCAIRHAAGRQDTLGGVGQRSFLRRGVLVVTIHTLSTSGLSEAYALSKVVVDAFEGVASPGGVWFRNVRINELGRDGTFNMTNVVVEFEYYELK